MLEGQHYKQFIQQQGLLQQNIAEGWGYQVNPQQYLIKIQKINNNLKIAKIKPLKNNIREMSKELWKVQSELKQIKDDKKMYQSTSKALAEANKHHHNQSERKNQSGQAMKLMHQRIDEYNFIVQHRHIIQKNSEKARKILGIHKKDKSQIILEQIQALKQQLNSKNTIAKTIKINQQIVQQYKFYKQSLFKSKSSSERQTSTLNPLRKTSITKISKEEASKVSVERPQQSRLISKDTSKSSSTKKKQPFISMKLHYSRKKSRQQKSIQNLTEMNKSIKKDKNDKTDDYKFGVEDLIIMQEMNESEQGDSYQQNPGLIHRYNHPTQVSDRQQLIFPQSLLINNQYFKMKRKSSQHMFRKRMFSITEPKEQENVIRKQKMLTTISEVYNKKNQFERGKKLDKHLNESKDVLEIWKHRINQNVQKNQKNTEFIHLKSSKPKRLLNSILKHQKKEQQLLKKEEQFNTKRKSMILKDKIELIKQNIYEQQKMFQSLVKKKISKFKKIRGTNLIQTNNAIDTAKEILGTTKNRKKPFESLQSKLNSYQKLNTTSDVPQWMIIESMNKTFHQT